MAVVSDAANARRSHCGSAELYPSCHFVMSELQGGFLVD